MTVPRDAIYAQPYSELGDFAFDEKVAEVFPDMINRSVPGYATMVHTIGRLAGRFAQPDSVLYDLGCSLGASTLALKQNNKAPGCSIIGIDSSAAMVERCQAHVDAFRGDTPVHIEQGDILQTKYKPCSVVILNFTLQFIAPEKRQQLLQQISDAMLPGGLLVLSEKVREPETVCDQVLVDLHHDFKRDNGYSELEISQKRAALENVMRLDTLQQHQQRLQETGFSQVQNWYRCFNFTSTFAIK
ncbi:carboxy-S-adenosyl-L-methionine synthase CmoA [Aliidiomarina minuta]|uniref:Carboxy-S-adenosyl-L-methionine synthase n=1 Tax=Aliidiomarina minuta TaxID=880057 RepID=A0A432W8C0_9GAMM|nr:carboxy-S-adenosyl-L-methionine synthase CmoA [Aliidiomarina minuta]RUO26344.1 carboxy-S-adenosyl-L-methionine synthase CmoA [Aliidiomarina minuta]